MADVLIQERYQLDFDAAQATENIILLAVEADRLRTAIDKAKVAGQAYEKEVADLTAVERQLVTVLGQEVRTYDGMIAKRRILQLSMTGMAKGTDIYRRSLQEVQNLEKRELNTLDGLNAKRQQLRTQLGGLEIGTRQYKNTLNQLNVAESKAAQATGAITKSAGGFATALRGGLASIGIVFGLQQVLQLGRDALDASAKRQQQKTALLSALNNQVDVQERLIAQAELIEEKTLVDDVDIIALDRYLASLGKTEAQIRLLNDASTDLAAVKGVTVRQATDLLIGAENGQVKGLRKLIPEVKNLTKEQLAAGKATELVAKKFKGSAEQITTGVIGAKNKLKDLTDSFQELSGDAITRGLAANLSVFSSFSGEGAAEGFKRIRDAAVDTIQFVVSIPAYIIALFKAIGVGIGRTVEFVSDATKGLLFDMSISYREFQKSLGITTAEQDKRLADLIVARNKITFKNRFGFFNTVDAEMTKSFEKSLSATNAFFDALKTTVDEKNDEPPVIEPPKFSKGSLADLENQLSKLREKLEKFTKADDRKAFEPLLQKIAVLEDRIKKVRKAFADFIPEIANFDPAVTRDVQQFTIARELEKAKIEEQFIREQDARRRQAIEDQQFAEIRAAGENTQKKLDLENRFQRDRELLALETDRRITVNAIQQRQLELQELLRTSTKPGENAESIAKLKADIADLQARLSELQNKEVTLKVEINPEGKAKLQKDFEEIRDAAINLGLEVANALQAVFDRQEARANRAVDNQKNKLEEALKNSEDFTAQQIQLERDRLDKLNKEQERAAQRARAAQIAQVVANLVIAVAKTAGETGVAAPLFILTTLAAVAAGIASAVSLADDSFYEGTDYLKRGNNPKGKDTIPIRAHEGEAIIQADANEKYHPTVKAIRRSAIPADVLNGFVQDWQGGSQYIPRTRRTQLPDSVTGMTGGGNQNFYFTAKLQVLEREAAQQTELLTRIEKNSRNERKRNVMRGGLVNNGKDRFV